MKAEAVEAGDIYKRPDKWRKLKMSKSAAATRYSARELLWEAALGGPPAALVPDRFWYACQAGLQPQEKEQAEQFSTSDPEKSEKEQLGSARQLVGEQMVSGHSPVPRQVSGISLTLNLKAALHECVSSFVLCPSRPAAKSL